MIHHSERIGQAFHEEHDEGGDPHAFLHSWIALIGMLPNRALLILFRDYMPEMEILNQDLPPDQQIDLKLLERDMRFWWCGEAGTVH